MGKKTLYHPVSLHVIRGSAEYCGWKFGRLNQIAGDIETGNALYIANITEMPRGCSLLSMQAILDRLQDCFMDDIKVIGVSRSMAGLYRAKLSVTVIPEAVNRHGKFIE